MAKLKKARIKVHICETCHGNGYVRVATGGTSLDFRDNSQVHQCWDCDSEGEFYETVESDNLIGDTDGNGTYSNKLH
jgi:DnaJ-class molecular chaperone|tara:strand:- start:1532 stop:1762 length:231 start_codon:yes stop_codon:yes gene_type:complete